MELTLTNIAVIAGVASSLFAILSALTRALVEYLTVKISPNKMTVAEQSAQCRFDHDKITTKLQNQQNDVTVMIQAQNEHIGRLLEQNGEQLKYMRDASHNAELRHQITISRLDAILSKVAE